MKEEELGIYGKNLPLARDFSKKLRGDIFKAINHFTMLADVADFSGGEKITAITAVLERLLVDIYIEIGFTREDILRAVNQAYTHIKKARERGE